MAVLTGFDVLLRKGLYRDARIGLITNHTGLDRSLRQNYEIMLERGYRMTALFSPEHGIRGEVAEGATVQTYTDERTGIPVFSLYGKHRTPTSEMLSGIDVLIFDIQDIGARYYTYPSTMLNSMKTAAEERIPFVVLDRPNPIGGTGVEGNVPLPDNLSFVCYAPVPIRHGLTLGEIALLEARRLNLPAPVVIRAEGWERDRYYDEADLGPWVPLSPAASNLDMALLYPGTCLLEGTNLSEGRGTAAPFQMVGAPYVDPHALARELGKVNLRGVLIRPLYFTPWYWKYVGQVCGGVQFHIVDRRALLPVELGVRLLFAARDLFPEFSLRNHEEGDKDYLDLLAGGPELRGALLSGESPDRLLSEWREEASMFERTREAHLLY
ncbi:MAG: exo-beta-N-acetylmuramidase NamZ domain-containing protein [Bacillota bacterium]